MDSSPDYTASDYVAAFRRRRRVLMAVAIPVISIAVLLAAFLPDRYASVAQIDINLEGSSAKTLEPIEVSSYADQYIAKLEGMAFSRDNILALANDPTMVSLVGEEMSEGDRFNKIAGSVGVSLRTQNVRSPSTGREVDLISGFQVTSVDADPEFAFRVAEYFAKVFMEVDRVSRTERASSASQFLSEQIEITEGEIVALEQKIADFKTEYACCLPELVELNMSVIERAERDIENSLPRIRALEQSRVFLKNQLEEFGQIGAGGDRLSELEQEYMALVANYGPDHPDVNRVRREIIALTSAGSDGDATFEIIDLRMKLAEAEQRYSSEHPDVIRYKSQLAALESKTGGRNRTSKSQLIDNPRYNQLRAELNSVDSQLTELRRSQPALREKIEEYESRLARTPQIESEYQAIIRSLQSTRDNFDDLQRRAVIARQSEALELTDIGARLVQVKAPYLADSPSGPPRLAILILGAFLAGTLGIGSMLFAELTDSTVRSSKDIATVVDMVPLATIPVIENSLSRKQKERQMFLSKMTGFIVIAVAILYVVKSLF